MDKNKQEIDNNNLIQSVENIIKSASQKGYKHINDFKNIITEIMREHKSIENLKHLKILELGPGVKLDLIKFLKNEAKVKEANSVGKHLFLLKRSSSQDCLKDSYILPYLKSLPNNHVDLIYSRFVMERYSIHPLILIFSPYYKNLIFKGAKKEVMKEYPSSGENIIECYKQIFKVLVEGGIIISEVSKKWLAELNDEVIKSLKFKKVIDYPTGKFSHIWVLRK